MPYVTTLHGLENGGGEGWLGMPGMYGTRPANWALGEADCIVAVGARFDDRVTGRLDAFAPHARVVHIDLDPSELGKLVPAEVAICAAAQDVLPSLRALVDQGARPLDPWWRRVEGWLRDHPLVPPPAHAGEAALDELDRALDDDAIITTDVGLHQMWAARRMRFSRRPALDHLRRRRHDGVRPRRGPWRAGGRARTVRSSASRATDRC